MDTDNSMVVTRGKRGKRRVKEGQIYDEGKRFNFGWWAQCNIQMMHHKIIHVKPI